MKVTAMSHCHTKAVSALLGSQSQGCHQQLFCWGMKGFYPWKEGRRGQCSRSISVPCFLSFLVAACPPCGQEWWSCSPVHYEFCSCIPRRLCRDGIQHCLGWSDEFLCTAWILPPILLEREQGASHTSPWALESCPAPAWEAPARANPPQQRSDTKQDQGRVAALGWTRAGGQLPGVCCHVKVTLPSWAALVLCWKCFTSHCWHSPGPGVSPLWTYRQPRQGHRTALSSRSWVGGASNTSS